MKRLLKEFERRKREETKKYRLKIEELIKRSPFLTGLATFDLPDPKVEKKICKNCQKNEIITFDYQTLETINMIVPRYNQHYLNVINYFKTSLFELCNQCRQSPICQGAIMYLNPLVLKTMRIPLDSVTKIYAEWIWSLWKEFDKINKGSI